MRKDQVVVMSMLDLLMGKGGAQETPTGTPQQIAESLSAPDMSSSEVMQSLNAGMDQVRGEAEESLLGISHNQLQAEMSQEESRKRADYEMV